jgi:hypothetical protein
MAIEYLSLCLEILALSLICLSLICPEIFGQGEFIPDIDQPRIEIGVSSEVGDSLELKDTLYHDQGSPNLYSITT